MSCSHEVESSVSPAGLFKAVILDWHNLGPKVLPDIVASAAAVEGDGGVGSVREIKFTSALPFSFVKECLDFIDQNKLECKHTLIGGGGLGTKLESASLHYKFEPSSKGGCVCKVVTTYKTLPGVQVKRKMRLSPVQSRLQKPSLWRIPVFMPKLSVIWA